jgi:hypothetical protein
MFGYGSHVDSPARDRPQEVDRDRLPHGDPVIGKDGYASRHRTEGLDYGSDYAAMHDAHRLPVPILHLQACVSPGGIGREPLGAEL